MPLEPSNAPSTAPSEVRSPPAQKPRPSPVRITTLRTELRAISLHSASSSRRISGSTALSWSGRLRVITPMQGSPGRSGLSCTAHLSVL